jgi:hypothetical protein
MKACLINPSDIKRQKEKGTSNCLGTANFGNA